MLEESGVYADPDSPALAPDSGYQSLAWKQLRETLQQQVDALPEKEGRVLAYHYFNGMEFEQVARLMGLSKGRISQLHKAGLNRLREQVPRIEHFSSA
jgi:RNA polymerase sigma factor for flagellar operon FliA